ncbi:MAG: hypothetical protein AAFX06_26390, partial [Planctomycetota bacterium]
MSGTLSGDDTWNGTIHVTGDVTVPDGVTLDIDPGTVVKFNPGRWLTGEGSIQAIGNAANPIVFTARDDDTVGEDLSPGDGAPFPGFWESLYLSGPDIRLEHAEVRYAGDNDGNGAGGGQVPSIRLSHQPDDASTNSELVNVLVTQGYSTGVEVTSGSPLLQNVAVNDTLNVPAFFGINASPNVSNLTGSGNAGGDRINLQSGTLSEDRTWDYGELPLHLTSGNLDVRTDGDGAPVTLSVAPGTVVKVPTGGFVRAREGTIQAIGTPAEPIVFTAQTDDSIGGDSNGDGDATTPFRGSWESLYLNGPGSALENVEVRFAGDTDGNGTGGGQVASIQLNHDNVNAADANRLTNVRISGGYGNGVGLTAGTPTFANVHVQDNAGVPFYFEIDANPAVSGLTGRDNDAGDRILLQAGVLTEDRTWDYGDLPLDISAGNYIVRNKADETPATLTIAPGTIVKVSQGWYLWADDGTIVASGTPSEPIIFTAHTDDTVGGDSNGDGDATTPYRGYWESIYLDGPNNIFENVEVRYAGDTDGNGTGGGEIGSLELRREESDGQPSLTNVRVSDGYSNAINVREGAPTLQNVHAEDNRGVPYFIALASNPTTSGLTGRNNDGGDRVVVEAGVFTTDRTWNFPDLPVHPTGSNVIVRGDSEGNPATLTIAPGTVVKMPQSLYVWADTGTLIADGTPEMPIVFTAATDDTVGGDSNGDGDATIPYRGYWESIYLDGPDNVLDNVEVRFAGDTDGNGTGGGQVGSVQLRREETEGAPQVSNLRILDGYGNGLEVREGTPTVMNVLAESNAGVPYYIDLNADATITGLSASNNDAGDHVLYEAGVFTSDRTLDFPGLPIHFDAGDPVVRTDGEGNPATLTIAPGSIVKVPQGRFLWADTGSIVVNGTPQSPIVITAITDDTVGGDSNGDGSNTVPFAGYWESIYLDGPNNEFSNVEIRYAGDTDGNGTGGGQVAALDVESDITLTNVNVTSTWAGALAVRSGATVIYNGGLLDRVVESTVSNSGILVADGNLTATDLDILDDDDSGDFSVTVNSGASATISNSAFLGSSVAVQHLGTDPGNANFQSNWWGSSAGPHDPSAADGVVNDNPAGESVSDFVDYGNFLTSPPSRAIGPRVSSLQRLAATTDPGSHHRYEADGTAFDEDGSRNGVLIDETSYAEGRSGGSSFLLDGDGDFVDLGSWAPASEWTVAAWVNPNTVPTTGRVGLAGSDSAGRDWSI